MASETSDLTFVRCPSCRSLVPASATRCRICNNPLDGLNKEDSDASKAATGRVRQKTITATPQEIEAALASAGAAKAAAAPPPPPPQAAPVQAVPPVQPAVQAPAHEELDDPLGAYMREVDSGNDVGLSAGLADSAKAAPAGMPMDDEDDLFDLDIFDDPIIDEAAPKATPTQAAAPTSPEPLFDEPDPPPPARAVEPPRSIPEPPPPAPEPMPEQPAKQMRVVEPPKQRPPQENRPQPQQHKGGGQQEQRRQDPPKQQGQGRSEKMQEQRQKPPHQQQQQRAPEPPRPPRRDDRDQRKMERPHRPEPVDRDFERREPAHVAGPKTGKMRPGRLFGWLVSYENPDGRAIEIREGKFFVTSSSIKGSDLVLEDPSISTPHALMSISDAGLLIQDLMSDHGVFVRSGPDDEYRREDGVIRISHGDWIRFGEVEFLVIVVPPNHR